MTPKKYDITIPQGATFSLPLQFKDGAGVALNMTGYTVAAQVWLPGNTVGAESELTAMTVTWVDRTTGRCTLSLSAAETRAMTSDGVYDVLVTKPDTTSDYWLRGAAKLERGYTR